ncbi:MAG: GAF domain-containing sensor histidine kinase [Anaerolineae bacterium]|nr:GAF domain-containing sensor histidine kinase [Anaerolineae bacterium]
MQHRNPQKKLIDLEHQVAILTRLSEVSTVLNSTMRLRPLLASIMDIAADITNAEAASVLLWERKSNTLRFAATTTEGGSGTSLIGQVVPLDHSIAGTVLRERTVLVVNDVRQDPRHYRKIDDSTAFQTRSVLGVPMTSKNRVIGVLEAINRRKLPWTANDVHYLSILAAQAAVAIEGTQLVTRLRRANEELATLDQLKNDFIAVASHELRTPLGIIMGYASFLQESGNPEVNDLASKVVNSALQLRRIIEDLTNLRYLQTDETDLVRQTTTLDELVNELMADVRGLAEAKGHRVELQIVPGIRISVDRGWMSMAINNLLLNAIRFTPDGGVITVTGEITGQREAGLSVRDNGMGIEKEELDKIFEKFYQIEDHMTRHHGGLGVGLSIAQGLVEAHGGRIWADSPGLNQGATFTIALPLAP